MEFYFSLHLTQDLIYFFHFLDNHFHFVIKYFFPHSYLLYLKNKVQTPDIIN